MASNTLRIAKTATTALVHLWEDKFFSAWKKLSAIEEYLAKRGNHFSAAELGMALTRAKYLTRRGKRTRYEYIQKHPFINEPVASPKKKSK